MEGTGLGAPHAIRQAMADALRRAADDLETKPMVDGRRRYNISFEGPPLYTIKPEEGPAALRAVAKQIAVAPLTAAEAEGLFACYSGGVVDADILNWVTPKLEAIAGKELVP